MRNYFYLNSIFLFLQSSSSKSTNPTDLLARPVVVVVTSGGGGHVAKVDQLRVGTGRGSTASASGADRFNLLKTVIYKI